MISAKWEQNAGSKFLAVIKVVSSSEKAGDYINNVARNLKLNLKGFSYKKVKDEIVFDIALEVSDKSEIDSAIRTFESVKDVEKVFRSE